MEYPKTYQRSRDPSHTAQKQKFKNLKFTSFRDLKSDQNLEIGHDVTDDINFTVIHPPSVDQ